MKKHCNKCQQEKEFTPKGQMCKDCVKEYNQLYYRNLNGERTNELHGMYKSITYRSWVSMKSRVLNPNQKHFKTYSKLGIYEPWVNSFQAFYDHIGPRPSKKHSLDRIINSLGYFPGNVRFAVQALQTRNKGNNVKLEYRGKVWLLCDLAAAHNIHQKLLGTRLRQGMGVHDALQPINYKGKGKLKEYA